MDVAKQRIEVFHAPEERVNTFVVRNVIAKIRHRRRINGRDPDGRNAKILQVIQLFNNPVEVPNPITIAVFK